MSLRDLDTERRNEWNPGRPCGYATARDLLDDDDRALLEEWMAVPANTPGRRSDAYLAALVNEEAGTSLSWQVVGHHRRGACRCFRP